VIGAVPVRKPMDGINSVVQACKVAVLVRPDR
jgi:hypothetical protein